MRDGHDASDSGRGLRRLSLQTGVAAMEGMRMIYRRKLSRMQDADAWLQVGRGLACDARVGLSESG